MLSALNPLSTAVTMAFFLLVGIVAFLASLMMCISVVLFEGLHHAGLSHIHIDIGLFLLWGCEGLLDFVHLLGREGVWEGDLEDDEKVAELIGLLMVGHTMTLNCLDIVRLDDLTRLVLYSDLTAVEVC